MVAIRIGISSCLLGDPVRFDGGHKRDSFLAETMDAFVEWVAVCPEVEAGFGTPRETMRLEQVKGAIRLITTRSRIDVTSQLAGYADRRVDALAAADLSGYVLKKDSPSCGMERVTVYDAHGTMAPVGRGVFAERLLRRFPALPVEDEGRLADPRLRENFIERVFAYDRLRRLFAPRWTAGAVVRFHTAHKLVLMAHSPEAYRRLGRLVAGVAGMPRPEFKARYKAGFMAALTVVATPARHANVLQHIAGYFKRQLDSGAKADLLRTIEDYRRGLVPLSVPIALVRKHARRLNTTYLTDQIYLDPDPREVSLQNRV